MVDHYLACFDTGTHCCAFLEAFDPSTPCGLQDYLGFAEQLKHHAREVLELIKDYVRAKKDHPDLHQQILTLCLTMDLSLQPARV